MLGYAADYAMRCNAQAVIACRCCCKTGGGRISIHERFPGLHGIMLQRKIRNTYYLEEGLWSPWFAEDGSKMFSRHPKNDRAEADTRRMYKESVLREGLSQGINGDVIAVPTSYGSDRKFMLMSFATRMEAVYDACEEDPTNPMVQETIRCGVKNIVVVDKRSPDDILRALKEGNNKWNKIGSEMSYLERYHMINQVEQKWKAYCKKRKFDEEGDDEDAAAAEIDDSDGDGVGDASYEKRYTEFLDAHFKDQFSSFNQFCECKRVVRRLSAPSLGGLHQQYEEYANAHCQFSNKELNQGLVTHANDQICKKMKKFLVAEMAPYLKILLSMALPTNDFVPWVMRESKVFQLSK
eukprot:7882571-Pyramimonas_sp.AAC.4